MRALIIVIVLAAAAYGGWLAIEQRAARIEADIDTRVRQAVLPIAKHAVEIETSGRHVTITGIADTAEERQRLLDAARAVDGQVEVTDALRVLETVQPYTLRAWRAPDGRISITGLVPSREVEETLIAAAGDAAEGAGVEANLTLAAGMPDADWIGMVEAGLVAMSTLEDGSIRLSDRDGLLSGIADGIPGRDTAIAELSADGFGNWQTDIRIKLPVISPYSFTAAKTAQGFSWQGYAPNEEISARLIERATILGGKGASGEITLADGMPGDAWPGLVESGLGSLSLLRDGRLSIEDMALTLEGSVDTAEDLARLEATFGSDWSVSITVLSPDPAPRLLITMPLGGQAEASGRLPKQFDLQVLPAVLPDIDAQQVTSDSAGDAGSWEALIDALAIITPRLREAEVDVSEGRIRLEGTVKREFEAQGTRAALNAALPQGWQADIAIDDAPPLPALRLDQTGEIALSGILPEGLAVADALALSGATEGTGLSADGDGDAEMWRNALTAGARIAAAYQEGVVTIEPGEISAEGALRPGYGHAELSRWTAALVPEGWEMETSGTELAAVEGDRRINLATLEAETFTGNHWLPELQITPTQKTCNSEARAALGAQKITFVTGSARIDAGARILLNRLAAIAIACANETGLRLEISGHTDDVGAEAQNQQLSERRAAAVREALVARGVDGTQLTAIGLGEEQPVAENDTEEGRARNRRIEFLFTE
ncbi:MAG: OmpA family protein [Pseudomonadota bacterium]